MEVDADANAVFVFVLARLERAFALALANELLLIFNQGHQNGWDEDERVFRKLSHHSGQIREKLVSIIACVGEFRLSPRSLLSRAVFYSSIRLFDSLSSVRSSPAMQGVAALALV
jgi:hypothetical protein